MFEHDQELERVLKAIRRMDSTGERIAQVLRRTFDQLYDGQHTGRYRWDQLHKTEKTHCGSLVEINLFREFKFASGDTMDYRIDGIEVDCKYSQTIGGWMIPPETVGHLCLVISANDEKGRWNLGIVRIKEEILGKGRNRDAKRSITSSGCKRITWIFRDAALPPNVLLQLPRDTVERIMAIKSGQGRIDEIFRVAQQQRIGRGVIATLGQQKDFMKRVRGNGGSRTRLKSEGILILGHYKRHREIARRLHIPVPQHGESVSVRIVPAEKEYCGGTVDLDGLKVRVAGPDDPVVPAPNYPHS